MDLRITLEGSGLRLKRKYIDIYAPSLLLEEIVTGKRPVESDTLAGLMRAQGRTS